MIGIVKLFGSVFIMKLKFYITFFVAVDFCEWNFMKIITYLETNPMQHIIFLSL
jgi:hypothetical protein